MLTAVAVVGAEAIQEPAAVGLEVLAGTLAMAATAVLEVAHQQTAHPVAEAVAAEVLGATVLPPFTLEVVLVC